MQAALHDFTSINTHPQDPTATGFVTVTKSGNVYTVTFFGSQLWTYIELTGTGIGGASVSIDTIENGGAEYAVGRIDMANLDAMSPNAEDSAYEIEVDQLIQYFQRSHDWRMGAREVSQQALLDEIFNTHPVWGAVKSKLLSIVGTGNVSYQTAWREEFDDASPTHYLFGSIVDGGDADVIWNDFDPEHSPPICFPQIASYDFADLPVNALFTTFIGSYMGDWNARSLRDDDNLTTTFTDASGGLDYHIPFDPDHPVRANLVRSALAGDGDALISTLYNGHDLWAASGWFQGDAPLGWGYTAGDGFLEGLRQTAFGTRMVNNQLFGDPTVRMTMIKPIANLQSDLFDGIRLQWTASTEPNLLGYYIYRASSMDGPYTRITEDEEYVTGTSFIDTQADPHDENFYMVRAIKDTQTQLGTYENASTGLRVVAPYITEGGGGGGEGRSWQSGGDASFIGSDDTTHGDWVGSYGGSGYFLASGSSWNPDSFVDFNVIDQVDQLWDEDSDESGALIEPDGGPETRVAAAWTSTTSFVVELNFNDNDVHRVSLYFQDYGDKGRMQKIEFYDSASGNMLSQHAITDFSRGKFMTWEVSGHVKVRITRVAGPDAVVSGVFVDTAT